MLPQIQSFSHSSAFGCKCFLCVHVDTFLLDHSVRPIKLERGVKLLSDPPLLRSSSAARVSSKTPNRRLELPAGQRGRRRGGGGMLLLDPPPPPPRPHSNLLLFKLSESVELRVDMSLFNDNNLILVMNQNRKCMRYFQNDFLLNQTFGKNL